MSIDRREFLQFLAIAGAAGFFPGDAVSFSQRPGDAYDIARFGNATLLHLTDCHAQLLPSYYRESPTNIGVGEQRNRLPHLTGSRLLEKLAIQPGSAEAYLFSAIKFEAAARTYGKTGGFAYLASLIKRLRSERGENETLLLDGGDSWQGSATALWTNGQDMVESSNLLGVDAMTGHWEFSYGEKLLRENSDRFKGEFLAQNIFLTEEAQFDGASAWDEASGRVFKPYTIRRLGDARVAIIGQAFPYTPIANPRRFVPDWRFGIEEERLQKLVAFIRETERVAAVVLLSHNGMDVDLKLASRVSGIDFVLGGHTHDAIPKPIVVKNRGGQTVVTNAGSNGKFLGLLDMDLRHGRLHGFRYRLLPIFSNLIEPDKAMQQLIEKTREPYKEALETKLAVAGELLFRRDNFIGSWDQLICDALREHYDAEIALSPGFRWGTSLLPDETITLESVMNLTAVTYPESYSRKMTGSELHRILEDVCDNLFNKDPYYQQGGDMVRTGGLRYHCKPRADYGKRISQLVLDSGKPIEAGKHYRVAGWATTGRRSSGPPVWEIVTEYLKGKKVIEFKKLNRPFVDE